MDENYEKLKARVDALELAVKVIDETADNRLRDALSVVFRREYDEALRQASQTDEINMSVVRTEPRPASNRQAESARVAVFRHFAEYFRNRA
ncbi:hypothetical protein PQQ77_15160 [Paraburkholderia strydomiana]|uniref:hypothetical protein n=1 Tax=Paraburkholderia strydomiana TaxID=1245417 RepID=UPI0038BE064F